jgi:glutamate formiminotransferase
VVGRGALAECVINVSEGRDQPTIDAVREAGGAAVLDVHSDPEHHRSVLTLGGPLAMVEDAARNVVLSAVARIDLRAHVGLHPRLGAADVVPFVPLPSAIRTASPGTGPDTEGLRSDVLEARDRFAVWAGTSLQLPCFVYGPERSLPDIRRTAFRSLKPDTGPPAPHPTAGATAVGARAVLVAYNVWIASQPDGDPEEGRAHALSVARALAAELRGATVRSLGLAVGAGAQVSFNLTDPVSGTIPMVYDAVAAGAESRGCSVLRAELVGLLPASALEQVPPHRWPELDLAGDRTIEGLIQTRQ